MSRNERAGGDDSRREFIKRLGTALGGVALVGGSGAGILQGQGAIPSGYKFFRVIDAGDGKSYSWGQNPVAGLGAAVMVGTFNHPGKDAHSDVIYFHGTPIAAVRPGNPQMLFQAELDYSASKPQLRIITPVVAQGDELREVAGVPANQLPIVVGTLGIGSANASANYATTITVNDYGDKTPDGSVEARSAPGVYLYQPLYRSWTKIARLGDACPEGGQYGGIFGDVVLNDDNSVTLVAATTAPPASAGLSATTASRSRVPEYVGSHAIVQVSPEGGSFIVLKTGDMLPGTAAMVESFGLIDLVDTDHFVAQVNARRLDILNALPGTAVVRGRLQSSRTRRMNGLGLLTASSHLLANGGRGVADVLRGDSIIGPRIGADGYTALVTHDELSVPGGGSLDLQRLTAWSRVNRKLILRAGDVGQDQLRVSALSAPVVSSQAPITYQAQPLDDGTTQLVVTDGTTSNVILKSGDSVEGLRVTEILHGYHPAQVDVAGRLAFAAEFVKNPALPLDAANILSCIVVGIPV